MSRPIAAEWLFGSVTRLFAAGRALAVALRRRGVLGDLSAMDDRMLRDIGLTRQDLWSVAAGPLFRDPTVGLAARADDGRRARRGAAREARLQVTALRRLWAEESRAA